MAFLSDSHFHAQTHDHQNHDDALHLRPNWSLFTAVSLNAVAWIAIMWLGVKLI